MRELAVIVPSRGRPEGVRRLLEAIHRTYMTTISVVFAFDEDDPLLAASQEVVKGWPYVGAYTGPRRTQVAWANNVASVLVPEFSAVALLADDNVPLTRGWDRKLLDALREPGICMASANDLSGNGARPSHIVMTAQAVQALGWIAEPTMSHYFVDNVWEELGRRTGSYRYLPDVEIDHVWRPGREPADKLREEELTHFHADQLAFRRWRAERSAEDAEKLNACQ